MRYITPDVWGEPMWRTIHVVAMGLPRDAPKETKQAYVDFYESLKTVIPCIQCSDGYTKIVGSLKTSISEAVELGPDALFSWTVEVHNRVASKLGQEAMTEDYVRDHYIFADPREGTAESEKIGDAENKSSGDADTETSGAPRERKSALRESPEDEFRRHSRHPVIVCLAATVAVGVVLLILWYAARVCTAPKARTTDR